MNKEERQQAIQCVSNHTGVSADAVEALNLPEQTLEKFYSDIQEAGPKSSKALKLGLVFAAAAAGLGYVALQQPLSWEVFSASSYPSWAMGTSAGGAILSMLATVLSLCIETPREASGRIHNDLRQRIVLRRDELAVIRGADSPKP